MEGQTDGRTDRGKTVYPPPTPGSGGIIIYIDAHEILRFPRSDIKIDFSPSEIKLFITP